MQLKNNTRIRMETIYTRDFFFWWKDLEQKIILKSSFLFNSTSWNCVQYIVTSRGAVFFIL